VPTSRYNEEDRAGLEGVGNAVSREGQRRYVMIEQRDKEGR
jgi:hypothetical protein